MTRTNRILVIAGTVLIGLTVFGLIARQIQDAQVGDSTYYQDPDAGGVPGLGLIAFAVGALLVLLGVIQHATRNRDR